MSSFARFKLRLALFPMIFLVPPLAVTSQAQTSTVLQGPQSAAPGAAPASGHPAAAASVPADSGVVTFPATVRDKHGQIVRSLSKDNFVLKIDGDPETIGYFSEDSNMPTTLGALFDTSSGQSDALGQEKSASKSFLDQMIANAKDRGFVIHFDRVVELLQDVTPDRGKLDSALGLLESATAPQGSGSGNTGSSGRPQGEANMLYDSIFLASDELMKKQTGRKALVVLSDGVDRGSKEPLIGAIEAAQRAHTVVYSIYFPSREEHTNPFRRNNGSNTGNPGGGNPGGYPGGGYPGGGNPGGYPGGGYPGGGYPGGGYPGGGYPGGGNPGGGQGPQRPLPPSRVDGKKILEQISGETGGRFYAVTRKQTVDQIYSYIADELHAQYMMGFTPTGEKTSGYHSIDLTTKDKDQWVQTMAGYYAGP